MLELIGVCDGSYTSKGGKVFYTFLCSGVIGFLAVAQDFAKGVDFGKKYILRIVPRKYEDKAFLTYQVVGEV